MKQEISLAVHHLERHINETLATGTLTPHFLLSLMTGLIFSVMEQPLLLDLLSGSTAVSEILHGGLGD